MRSSKAEKDRVKEDLIINQDYICPICGKSLRYTDRSKIVIDHDHTTGIVRGALHKGCNGLEGKVKILVTTWGKAKNMTEVVATLERLIGFWKLHSKPQTNIIYYNHKTQAEKRAAYNRKRRKQRRLQKGV